MTSTLFPTLALAIGLLAATATSAALRTISGTVVAKDLAHNTVTVETDTGERLLFRTLPTTLLKQKDGTVLSTTAVEVGDRVEVSSDVAVTPAVATEFIVLMPVSGGIVTAPGADHVDQQTDNTGKASGYRPSQQIPAGAD